MPTLQTVSVVTAHLAEAIDFYSRLGLKLTWGDAEQVHAELSGDGLKVALDTEALILQLDPDWTRPTGGHAIALAFGCATPAEVDETFQLMVDHGAPRKTEPWDAFWGQRYASVLDPDGNQIDLFAALEA